MGKDLIEGANLKQATHFFVYSKFAVNYNDNDKLIEELSKEKAFNEKVKISFNKVTILV